MTRSALWPFCWLVLGPGLVAEAAPGWVDIPVDPLMSIADLPQAEAGQIRNLAAAYHELPKGSRDSLAPRIEALGKIADGQCWLAGQSEASGMRETLLQLERHTRDKRSYLADLAAIPDDRAIEKRFQDSSALADRRYTPLPLRDELLCKPGPSTCWGKFWLEALDPCHRQLAGFYHDYLGSRPATASIQDFFLWLESRTVPDTIPVVRYLSGRELAPLKVRPCDGILVHPGSGAAVNTMDGIRYLYVIDLQKQLYLAAASDNLFHSSLSGGKPVLGSGLLKVKDGVVQAVNFESGHYRPTLDQGHASIVLLAEMGAGFADPLVITFFEDGRSCQGKVGAKDLVSLHAFRKALRTEGIAAPVDDGH